MKKFWKKGIAALLSASMLMTGCGSMVMAEEVTESVTAAVEEPVAAAAETETAVTESPATEAPATEAPATEALATEAPATEAPATEAPATEAPATEAPATEAPATEAPATEAPATEAPATEAPAAEAPATEAPVTEKKAAEKISEKETAESETEEEGYIFEEKDYTVEVELPDDVKLPEGTELKVRKLKKSDETGKEDLAVAEKEAGTEFSEYEIYDICFEKDGKEAELKERDKEDLKVIWTFEKDAFDGSDFTKEELKIYHIKDMTEQELSEARQKAEEENDTDKVYEQKAVELKTDITYTSGKDGVEKVTFQTDGFSDYVFAVIPEETETETETETVAVTETEIATEAETENSSETETAETETAAVEDAAIAPVNEGGSADLTETGPVLTVQLGLRGASAGEKPESCQLKITGETAEPALVTIKDDKGAAIAGVSYDEAGKTWSIPVKTPAEGAVSAVQISGLTSGGAYTVSAGGNELTADNKVKGTADFTTVYHVQDGETFRAPTQIQLTGDQTVSVTNLYTKAVLSFADVTDGKAKGLEGITFGINSENGPVKSGLVTDSSGTVTVKGLPLGTYVAQVDDVPKTYVKKLKDTQSFELTEEKTDAGTLSFTTTQIILQVQTMNSDKEILTGAEYKISGTDLVLNAKNNSTLSGKLEWGKTYQIEQIKAPYGYVKASKAVSAEIKNLSGAQVIPIENKPTEVKVSVVSAVTQKGISGVSLQIQDTKGNAITGCKWVSDGSAYTLKAKLEAGKKYQVVETAVPDGYLKSAGKEFTVNSDGTVNSVVLQNQPTQVIFSRKGYDSKKATSDGKYEYTNLKMLPGAVLEVQDLNGNTIERWTTTEEPYTIEGKLAAGTKYKLVEITTPAGYEKGGSGEFTTREDEKPARVTMQTRKASGKIQVAMRATLKGTAIKLNKTFYCALFLDEGKTNMYTDGGVKALQMTSDTVYATATFTNVPAGTYYVAETDASGNVIRTGSDFTVTYTNEKLNLTSGMSLLAEIVNDYHTAPTNGYTTVSDKELQESYNQEYQNYGGSAQAAATLAAGDGTVATGDTTNIILYVVLLAAAVLVIGAVLLIRKKRK